MKNKQIFSVLVTPVLTIKLAEVWPGHYPPIRTIEVFKGGKILFTDRHEHRLEKELNGAEEAAKIKVENVLCQEGMGKQQATSCLTETYKKFELAIEWRWHRLERTHPRLKWLWKVCKEIEIFFSL